MKKNGCWENFIIFVWVAVIVLILYLILTPPSKSQTLTPQAYLPLVVIERPLEIVNSGFEMGQWKETAWCEEPCEVLSHEQFQEIQPPYGWTAVWRDSGILGRPEVTITTDPARIHSGLKALKWFTFWRKQDGGIAQQIGDITLYLWTRTTHALMHADFYVDDVVVWRNLDGSVSVELWMQGWYTQCSLRPYDSPYDYDCVTPIDWAHQYLSVGVDFSGGPVDPRADIVWSDGVEQYGMYTDAPLTFVIWPEK